MRVSSTHKTQTDLIIALFFHNYMKGEIQSRVRLLRRKVYLYSSSNSSNHKNSKICTIKIIPKEDSFLMLYKVFNKIISNRSNAITMSMSSHKHTVKEPNLNHNFSIWTNIINPFYINPSQLRKREHKRSFYFKILSRYNLQSLTNISRVMLILITTKVYLPNSNS